MRPVLVVSLAAAFCARSAFGVAQTPLAIVDVSTIDATHSPARRDNQTILIENGRITAIGPRASVAVPRNARRIDGAGRFVIPGLWDSHVHFMNAGVTALPVLLAHGVTTVREMGGFLDSTRVWQTRMREGTLQGPRIMTPGPILESPRYLQGVRDRSERLQGRLAPRVLPYRVGIATADDARRVIDSLVGLHVDFVKVRTVASPDAFYAIVREAHRAGLRVAGHSPGVVPSHVAADSGQDDIEHALVLFTPADRALRTQSFVAHKTWYTPTLVVTQAGTVSGDSANTLIFGPRATAINAKRGYASPWLLGWWRMQVDERIADTSSTNAANARRIFESSLEDVRAFHAAGVRILAGTDAGSVLVYPGPSLHEELALLVQAGLTPRDALWSATAGPSQFAGLDSSVGRLAAGQVADLVILDADPLANISNTRRIRAVVQAGRLFDRATLDAMLARVRAENGGR